MSLSGITSKGEGKFMPSSNTTCAKCSTRVGLQYAFAYGKDLFLCTSHYRAWHDEAVRDPEITRLIPGRDRWGAREKDGAAIRPQDRKIF